MHYAKEKSTAYGTEKIEVLSIFYEKNKHCLSTFWENLSFFENLVQKVDNSPPPLYTRLGLDSL